MYTYARGTSRGDFNRGDEQYKLQLCTQFRTEPICLSATLSDSAACRRENPSGQNFVSPE